MSNALYTEIDPGVRDPLPILMIGVGHAGGSLIAHLPRRVPELSYAALDTDQASLSALPIERKLLLGEEVTRGMGTGGSMEQAAAILEPSEAAVFDLLEGSKVLMLVAGLGGGTGGGVGPLLAERAREAGLTVLCALVQPLEAEGGARRQQAEEALAHYREVSHSVLLFPLESLKSREEPSMLLSRLIKRCGLEISRSMGGLAMLLRSGWLMPLRLQDLVQLLNRADGYCRLVALSAEGESRVDTVLDGLFSHPLLDAGSLLAHSGGVILGLLCGPNTPLVDLERISFEVRRVLRSDAEFKIGVAQDERFGQHLALVVMVAEHWSSLAVATPPREPEESPEQAEAAAEGSSPADNKLVQSEIDLQAPGKTRGRFKNIQPTIVEGEDLDQPTFLRKGLRLSFQSERRS